MTEQTKAVFSDPKLLREKLNEFLQTPNSVEIYAQAAEKFFAARNKEKIELVGTWDWCCFFINLCMLLYRRCYGVFFIFLVVFILVGLMKIRPIGILFNVLLTARFKYYVIKRFEKTLDLGEVEFVKMSGRHKYLPWIICVLFIGLGLLSQIE